MLLAGAWLGRLAFDFWGHGESQGCLDAEALHDIRAAIAYLRGRPEVDANRLAIRGSSMGGHYAIHAGAAYPALKAVVAICPSSEANLERGIFNILTTPKCQGESHETD